jgi:uncharacterized membrane protein
MMAIFEILLVASLILFAAWYIVFAVLSTCVFLQPPNSSDIAERAANNRADYARSMIALRDQSINGEQS